MRARSSSPSSPTRSPWSWYWEALDWCVVLLPAQLPSTAFMFTTVAVGVVVDSTLFFLLTYQQGRTAGFSGRRSLERTLDTVGPGIVVTGLALTVGTATLLSGELVPIKVFGGLLSSDSRCWPCSPISWCYLPCVVCFGVKRHEPHATLDPPGLVRSTGIGFVLQTGDRHRPAGGGLLCHPPTGRGHPLCCTSRCVKTNPIPPPSIT